MNLETPEVVPSDDSVARSIERVFLTFQEEKLGPFQILAVCHAVTSIVMGKLHDHMEFVSDE